ncbi:MAG: DNA methyltransferase [Thermoplasmata archaeon]
MKILSEFLGEWRNLSMSEIAGLLKAYGGIVDQVKKNYVIFETEHPREIASRITFSRRLARVIEGDSADIGGKTFSIRERKETGRDSMIAFFAKRVRGRVNLSKPDVLFFIYNYDSPMLTEVIFERKEKALLDERYGSRPFNHPSSISPLLARGMINIASLREDQVFVDPFVGTGTFLIEGQRMGIRGIGIDRDRRMVEGCRRNLDHFGLSAKVIHGDFSLMKTLPEFSAVVTDPPYGRGARIFSDSRDSLYDRFFSLLAEIEVPKVFALPSYELYDLARQYLDAEILERIRVHSSLTRLIVRA